jgi:hypothetical protein
MSQVISSNCQAIKTDNGNFLVKTNDGAFYYADPDGNFIRTPKDGEKEWEWALSKWKNPSILEESELAEGFLENLKNCLKYLTN